MARLLKYKFQICMLEKSNNNTKESKAKQNVTNVFSLHLKRRETQRNCPSSGSLYMPTAANLGAGWRRPRSQSPSPRCVAKIHKLEPLCAVSPPGCALVGWETEEAGYNPGSDMEVSNPKHALMAVPKSQPCLNLKNKNNNFFLYDWCNKHCTWLIYKFMSLEINLKS